jgi:hypothetical protein
MKTTYARYVLLVALVLASGTVAAKAQASKPSVQPPPAAAPARDFDKELAELQKQSDLVQMRLTQNYRALEHLEEFQQWLKDYQVAQQLQAQANQLLQQKAAKAAEAAEATKSK